MASLSSLCAFHKGLHKSKYLSIYWIFSNSAFAEYKVKTIQEERKYFSPSSFLDLLIPPWFPRKAEFTAWYTLIKIDDSTIYQMEDRWGGDIVNC